MPLKEPPANHRHQWCLNWSYFLSPATIAAGLEYMQGDSVKHENTARYLERLAELEDDVRQLSPEFLPARHMKVMKARSGVRIKFEDERGTAFSLDVTGHSLRANAMSNPRIKPTALRAAAYPQRWTD